MPTARRTGRPTTAVDMMNINIRRLLAVAATTFFTATLFTMPALASVPRTPPKPPAATQATRDLAAYRWALTQTGKWYQYGSTGPSTYDCSGLVYAAYRHEGLTLPRTTYTMVGSRHLVRVSHPQRGDLAFYWTPQSGWGHVEFYAGGHRTFGAHSTGERISYRTWNAYWHPTLFLRVTM